MSNDFPDPELVNPEKYVAALASFQGRDVVLSEEDIALFTGEVLEDELEELREWGMLERSGNGYRPSGDYALKVSERCEERVYSIHGSAIDMLEDSEGEEIMEDISSALNYS